MQKHRVACSCTAKIINPAHMPKKKKLAFLHKTQSVPKLCGFGTDCASNKVVNLAELILF